MPHNRRDGRNSKLQVDIQPNIGLESDIRHTIVDTLNIILADESVLAMKTRSALWHAHGPGFLNLQTLLSQQYHLLNKAAGRIAERVHILGGFALCSFEEFINSTRLEEQPREAQDSMNLLADHESSIRFLREDARKCFEEHEDHGTYIQVVQLIRMHEKLAWMLRSYIEPESTADNQL